MNQVKFVATCLFVLGLFLNVSSANAQEDVLKMDVIGVMYVNNFDHVYSDRGTGAEEDLSIWKPQLPSGYHALGHYAKAGYDAPTESMPVVRAIDPTALAHPVDYQRFYADNGTGGDQDASFWIPIPPAGYKALGTVAMSSYNKPSLTDVVCVRENLVVPAVIGQPIWTDRASGGDMDVALWAIEAVSHSGTIPSGSFCGHASYNQLTRSEVCYALKTGW
ncbi:MAG: Vps62-related protein [Chitinophagales bacterium]